jgi:hypothetical protein
MFSILLFVPASAYSRSVAPESGASSTRNGPSEPGGCPSCWRGVGTRSERQEPSPIALAHYSDRSAATGVDAAECGEKNGRRQDGDGEKGEGWL